MSIVSVKGRVGRLVLDAARPLFAWRSRIIMRKFCGGRRWYDAATRAAIERFVHVFEAWEAGPGFTRTAEMLAELQKIQIEVDDLMAKVKRETEKK